MKFLSAVIALLLMSAFATSAAPDSLRMPAHTAYIMPDPNGARVAEGSGVTRWSDPAQSVNWYGELKQTGDGDRQSPCYGCRTRRYRKLQLSVAGQSREVEATGRGLDSAAYAGFRPVRDRLLRLSTVHAGIAERAGPARRRSGLAAAGRPAVVGAHFNLKERRNAASVHLMYPVPGTRTWPRSIARSRPWKIRRPSTWRAAGIAAISACRSTARPSGGSFSACGTAATRR